MFEQSLLLDPAAGRKTGALATSLTLQTLTVAMVIALPLIFGDHLPKVPVFTPLTMPAPPPAPTPVMQESGTTSSSRPSVITTTTKVWTAPRRIVDLSEIPQITTVEAAPTFASASETGVIGSVGPANALSQLLTSIPQAKPPVVDTPKAPTAPIAVGGVVQAANLLKKIVPAYPALAKQARVSGTVRLMGIIGKDGAIQQLQVVSGHPLLVNAALEAVRQWIYRPTLLNGQPVEVIAPIDVIFSLSQ